MVLAISGCYAKHFPREGDPASPVVAAFHAPLRAGVRVRALPASPGAHTDRIDPSAVVEDFARELERARVFDAVVYPWSDVAPEADLIIEVSVQSRYDLQPRHNTFRQAIVGASLLLLQPVIATQWDLSVELSAQATRAGGTWSREYSAASTYRFEYTSLRPSHEALEAWSQAASRDAVVRLVQAVAEDQELAAQ